MSQRGRFISFEGTEGSGKSTTLERCAEWLESKGRELIQVREPGGTKLGEEIRHLLKHSPAGHGMASETELLLFAASRAEITQKIIEPALEEGTWVISDRFIDSTTVYQGIVRGIAPEVIELLNQIATGGLLPDLTLLFDIDAEAAQQRVNQRQGSKISEEDRLDAEPLEFHQKVVDGYRVVAGRHPQRIHRVDASLTPDEVYQATLEELKNAFHSELR